MVTPSRIVTSTPGDAPQATVDGEPVARQHDAIAAMAEAAIGPDGRQLFAYPEFGFSRARQAPIVTWYTALPGDFVPLDRLDPEQRELAEASLGTTLERLADRTDADGRAVLSAALNVPSLADVHWNGRNAILTNWGHLGTAGDTPAVGAAIAHLLPPSLALAAHIAPEHERGAAPPLAAPVALGTAAAAGASAALAHDLPPSGAPQAPRRSHAAAWWMGGVAAALLLLLAYVAWPGNLVYIERAVIPGPDPTLAAAEQANEAALEQRIGVLRAGLRDDVCVGDVAELDRIVGLPVLQEAAITGAPADPAPFVPPPAAISPAATEPQNPPHASIAPIDPAGSTSALLDRLDTGTVFIMGTTAQGVSSGSGIVVGPRQILTNAHVVNEMDGRTLVVANQSLGGYVPARVAARSPSSNFSEADFALLELEGEARLQPISFTTAADRLTGVIAAGFPGMIVASDAHYRDALTSGNLNRLAEVQMAVTAGEITARQESESGVGLILHTAFISPGNSGGPLADACGRVVGVNTYVRTTENRFSINFALAASDALEFLRSQGITVETSAEPCAGPSRLGTVAAVPAGPPVSAPPLATPQAAPSVSAAEVEHEGNEPPAVAAPAPSADTAPPADDRPGLATEADSLILEHEPGEL